MPYACVYFVVRFSRWRPQDSVTGIIVDAIVQGQIMDVQVSGKAITSVEQQMMKRVFRQLVAMLLAMLMMADAQAVLTIKITRGVERAQPIAIVPFAAPDSLPQALDEVVSTDLGSSGRFSTMPLKDMPSQPHEFSEINFKDWRLLGMENLVVGRVASLPDGSYEVQFRLIDVFKGVQLAGYKIPVDGHNLRLAAHRISDLVYEKLTGERGAFSTRIAYITVDKDTAGKKRYALQVADADGHNAGTLLTSPQPLMSPAWSPDGQRLAYVSFEGHNSAIWVQDVRSGKRERLVHGPGLNSAPAWSPDGKYLAMTLSRDGNAEIYILHLAGGRLQRLTHNPAIDTEPSWSVDGQSIAFTSDRGGRPQIYVREVLGGRDRRITFEGRYNARPEYSPDGQRLALVHQTDSGFHIAVKDLKTGALTVLTDTRLDESPSFAPNGQMIIYATTGSRGAELATVSVDGSVRQRLAVQQGEVREPAWGPFR